MKTVRRIIVFKPGPIGDFLHALPVVEALRNEYPDAFLCVVTGRELADLVDAHPLVDRKIYIPSNIFRGDPLGLLEFIGTVRGLAPDLFVDLKSNVKSFIVRSLSGARFRLRYRKQRRVRPGEKRLHAMENLLLTIAPLSGDRGKPEYRIYLKAEDERAADAFLGETLPPHKQGVSKVVLTPTVGWSIPSRLWPPEYFAALGDRILDELGAAVFITGAPSDAEYCGKIAERMSRKPVLTAGRLTLGQTAALIKRADLIVSGDTGPLHIAAGVGTRIVGLYGSVSIARSRPFGDRHVILKKDLPCIACDEKICPLGTMQCMKDIGPDEVFEHVRRLLSTPGPPAG
jgi:ADP-heptose:LPS heptosyltransferase